MKATNETWVCSPFHYLNYLLTSNTEQLKILNTYIPQRFEDTQSKFDKCYNSLSKLCKLLIQTTIGFNDDEDTRTSFLSDSINISSLSTLNNFNDHGVRERTQEAENWRKVGEVQGVSDCEIIDESHECESQSRAKAVTEYTKLLEICIQGVRESSEGLTRLMQLRTLYIELFQIMVTQLE